MQLTVSGGGLKATTRDHGLTEYWANRLTSCAAPAQFPRLFCWVYRHEGRRLRHELRCHAVLCSSAAVAQQIETELKESLALALLEFRRDKISRQNARMSLANSVYENPSIPRRKILLSTGGHNYKPPLERSKSAPKLTSIEEIVEEEDDASQRSHKKMYKDILKHCDSTSALLDKRKSYILSKLQEINNANVPATQEVCDNDNFKKRRVSFSEENESLMLDDRSDMILQELVESTLSNDLLESCERAWFNALGQKPDLIPLDSDEGSLSSGCESTSSTVTSDLEQPIFPTIEEKNEVQDQAGKTEKLTDLEFKVGGTVLSRVRSFEKLSNPDLLKYCGFSNRKSIIDQDEVSLIPVGESQSDFSSLKVFKKRSLSDSFVPPLNNTNGSDNEENGSASSDESGYEEEDLASCVSNIVLV